MAALRFQLAFQLLVLQPQQPAPGVGAQVLHGLALGAAAAQRGLGFGQPGDVASSVLFLLSDATPWISGVNLLVDGAAAVK